MRALGVATALVMSAAMGAYPAAAQGTLDHTECGFRVPFVGWPDRGKIVSAGDISFAFTEDPASSYVLLGPVWEIPAAGSSAEAQVLASAGQLCLVCARDRNHPLVWIDRFADGSKIVSYTIHRGRRDGQDGFFYSFFVLEKNVPEATGTWVRADLVAWMSESVAKEKELPLFDMVHGLALTRPDPNCWR